MIRKKHLFILVILFVHLCLKSEAGITARSSRLIGTDISGGVVMKTEDDQLSFIVAYPAVSAIQFWDIGVKNRVKLEWTRAARLNYSSAWTISMDLTIRRWNGLGTLVATDDNFTLAISYDPASGISAPYTDKSVYEYGSGYKTQVTINSVSLTGISSIPADVILENEIETERYYAFDPLQTNSATYNYSLSEQKLDIRWNFLPGVEEYDLEWMFCSDYASIPSGGPDMSNATRITTANNFYRISLTNDKGKYYFRLRGVGRWHSDYTKKKPGEWNTLQSTITFDNLDDSKNWKYDVSYAEEGKAKEVVGFYDGLLKARQNVTRSNTDNTALISETFYDFEGRPAVTTLPAPNADWNSPLIFYPNFSLSAVTSGALFSNLDFDNDALPSVSGTCSRTANGMSSTAGAGNYYSASNPYYTEGWNSNLPDAEHYPFKQITYGLDGRTKDESGFGSTLRIGGQTGTGIHVTSHHYGTPSQAKLDYLFGNEAGDSKHYSEEMTVDPNHILNISYYNMEGKVVATSVAGEPPASMDELDNEAGTYTINSNFNNLNDFDAAAEAYIVDEDFIVTTPGDYIFEYEMTVEDYESVCTNTDHHCVYDLVITISNECGETLGSTPYTHLVTSTDLPSWNPTINFTEPGTYHIRKILSLNQSTLESYVAQFMAALPGTCIQSLSDDQEEANNAVNTSECAGCEFTCRTNATNAGLTPYSQEWIETVVNCINSTCIFTGVTSANCDVLYKQLLEDMSPGGQYFDKVYPTSTGTLYTSGGPWAAFPGYNQECSGPYTSGCYIQPSGDLTVKPNLFPPGNPPYGSYTSMSFEELFMRTTGFTFTNSSGPHPITSWAQLNQYWQPGFADQQFNGTYSIGTTDFCSGSGFTANNAYFRIDGININCKDELVKFHPEYCAYEWCLGMETSTIFDANSNTSGLLAWAQAYPNSTTPFIDLSQTPVGQNMRDADPFFTDASHTSQAAAMDAILADYDGAGSGTASMWDYAGTLSGCSSTCDQQWIIFRGLYMSAKDQMVQALKAQVCPALYDQDNPPDNIADSRSGHPEDDFITKGMKIRDPDDHPGLNSLNPDNNGGFTDQLGDFGDSPYGQIDKCRLPAFSIYTFLSSSDAAYISLVGTGLLHIYFGTTDITCGGVAILADAHQTAANLAAAINSCITDPDFTAMISFTGAYSTVTIYAPTFLAATANSYTLTHSIEVFTDDPSIDHFSGGDMPVDCKIPEPTNCLCNQLHEMLVVSGMSQAEVTAQLNTEYGLANPINDADIDFWECMCTSVDQNFIPSPICGHAAFNNPPQTNEEVQAIQDAYNIYSAANHCIGVSPNSTGWNPYIIQASPYPIPPELRCDLNSGPCEEDAFNIAGYYASEQYQEDVDNAVNDFIAKYKAKCFKKVSDGGTYSENFTESHTESEGHFTLYYYDQAGNLVMTIPPAGVVPLSGTEITDAGNHRNDPVTYPTAVYPDHRQDPGAHYASNYEFNSLNKVLKQKTPDGGESNFWYDAAARLRFSQNAQQAFETTSSWHPHSYTKYDDQGRIIEVGECDVPTVSTVLNTQSFPDDGGSAGKVQFTHTFYDVTSPGSSGLPWLSGQENLRSRVSAVTYSDADNGILTWFDYGTHYSYDVHGNVSMLVQESHTISSNFWHSKTIRYDYDLISGNVKNVYYQEGKPDQYFHKYLYDADNRLHRAFTSKDNVFWDQDQKYFYYLHGPVARTETGEGKVQGTDYAYTLQGWTKAVNSNTLLASTDMGKDGEFTSYYSPSSDKQLIHSNMAQDAYGYSLWYFGDNTSFTDYTPINTSASFLNDAEDLPNSNDLYNGNIKQIAQGMQYPNSGGGLPDRYPITAAKFRYDKINRLKESTLRISTNDYYTSSPTPISSPYGTEYSYDPNGNIQTLIRKESTGAAIDDLTYHSVPASGTHVYNQLGYIDDALGSWLGGDLPDQSASNYEYDKTGNLTKDVSENITTVHWNIYGKVASIIKSDNTYIAFNYDGLGNRVCKKVRVAGGDEMDITYYVHDASGNVMAVYDRTLIKNAFSGGGNYHWGDNLHVSESLLYGSKRLGEERRSTDIWTGSVISAATSAVDPERSGGVITAGTEAALALGPVYNHEPGFKQYELEDHLGNVHTMISDKKRAYPASGAIDYYTADVIGATDYYPFGMQMPGRSYSSSDYRFGYNGQEKTDEINGIVGSHCTYKFREYNSLTGRFWSVDPLSKSYPWNSTYAFAENRPIDGFDLEGLEWRQRTDKNNEPMTGESGGYDWVGYDKDGKAPAGTVPEAYYFFDNSARKYSSDQVKQSGTVTLATLHQSDIAHIANLDPSIQIQAKKFLLRADLDFGFDLQIPSMGSRRTNVEQNELFARSRTQNQLTKAGVRGVKARPDLPWATNASAGKSAHQYGLAFDIARRTNPLYGFELDINNPNNSWERLHSLGMSLGLDWGGTWHPPISNPDRPHFQIPNWRNLTPR